MKTIITFFLLSFSFSANCQTDTIYTYTETIACVVKEVTTDAVRFSYEGEELINSVYKSTVVKIVFKSGRIQKFAESSNFRTVNSVEDYENVSFTQIENEVKGLFKIGEISASANAVTIYSNEKKIKDKAIKRMKIEAAMLGANIVFLTQNTSSGAQPGYYFNKTAEAKVDGVAYSNKVIRLDEVKNLIGDQTIFKTSHRYSFGSYSSDFAKSNLNRKVQVIKIYSENYSLMMNAKIDGVDEITFKVVAITKDSFTLCYYDKKIIYNYVIRVVTI